MLYHPTFLYESLWNVLGALLLIWLGRQARLQWGRLFGLYLVWYAIGRIWLESLRLDPIDLVLGIRVNQLASWLVLLLGVALFFIQGRRHPGDEPSPYLPGREPHVESTDAVEDEVTDEVDSDSAPREAQAKDGAAETQTN